MVESAEDPLVSEVANGHVPQLIDEAPSRDAVTEGTSSYEAAETTTSPSVPWYLQVNRDRERTAPDTEQAARVAIPDLPHNPPPLLQTLLEYMSITAGLDDLDLLDLRHLDPPPALGPKLIMIIGTARSEKHLHVSADRFCRYLRREHGLKANAAGLLGRNELKIKLRRKAKRMKMLANVGGNTTEPLQNLDDGIRTGWICCTVGKIEAHPEDTEMPGADVENFVGFRDVKPGVNVVFQMFTEEKRAEIDLETLWGGVLNTHDRKDARADEQLKDLIDDIEAGEEKVEAAEAAEREALRAEREARKAERSPTTRSPAVEQSCESFPAAPVRSQQWSRPSATKGDIFPPSSPRDTVRQIRRLHTVGLDVGHF
ncbi:hypothetical protein K491DRAFT_692783 [Lophiostoma macrostomum CBS 122681]|uniref:ATPase synthesis protein 25 n=1 Tax=Lophiostoma macrostomum CBS 122681 TaxID=1314788 RepID=A0A6A6T9H7_9PLEO|nr:hypothetical protein K491DRAFT_692783 [Lophiostoma macrostomum CBS 122681]